VLSRYSLEGDEDEEEDEDETENEEEEEVRKECNRLLEAEIR